MKLFCYPKFSDITCVQRESVIQVINNCISAVSSVTPSSLMSCYFSKESQSSCFNKLTTTLLQTQREKNEGKFIFIFLSKNIFQNEHFSPFDKSETYHTAQMEQFFFSFRRIVEKSLEMRVNAFTVIILKPALKRERSERKRDGECLTKKRQVLRKMGKN